MDQKEYMERVLSVAISAPPANPDKHPPPGQARPSFIAAPRKPMMARLEQKSRISFVPASVQKAATKDTNVPSPSQAAMSNDDFRKMLLK